MKTYKKLSADIAGFPNVYTAWRKACRGKRYTTAAAADEASLVPTQTLTHP